MIFAPENPPDAAVTVMLTASDSAVAPSSSVACALNVWTPTAALVHVTVKGADEASPIFPPDAKNSTLLTVPSVSDAAAVTAMAAGAVNDAPAEGAVIDTVGAAFGADTVMATGADTVSAPSLSTAVAVTLNEPGAPTAQ